MQTNPIHKQADLDTRVDSLYLVLKGRIRLDNLIPTCVDVAKEIEGIVGMKGPEKLILLQAVLRHAVKESDVSVDTKEKHLFAIDKGVPIIMEAIIFASKNPVLAHAVAATCVGCWTKK